MKKTGKTNAMRRLQALLQEAVSTGQLTVAEIAEKTGLEPSLVYKYMRGDRPGTSLDTFLALLDAVGAHPADVFGEKKTHPPSVIAANEAVGKYLKGK